MRIMDEQNCDEKVPKCSDDACRGIVKPDVVLYEEGLDTDVITEAVNKISNADLLIVGGTSLVVNPAASLIQYFKGDELVLINKDETPYDFKATKIYRKPIGEVLC